MRKIHILPSLDVAPKQGGSSCLTQDGLSAHGGRLAQSETIAVVNKIACPRSPVINLEGMNPGHSGLTPVEIDSRISRSCTDASFARLRLLCRRVLELVLLATVQHLQMTGFGCQRLLRDCSKTGRMFLGERLISRPFENVGCFSYLLHLLLLDQSRLFGFDDS